MSFFEFFCFWKFRFLRLSCFKTRSRKCCKTFQYEATKSSKSLFSVKVCNGPLGSRRVLGGFLQPYKVQSKKSASRLPAESTSRAVTTPIDKMSCAEVVRTNPSYVRLKKIPLGSWNISESSGCISSTWKSGCWSLSRCCRVKGGDTSCPSLDTSQDAISSIYVLALLEPKNNTKIKKKLQK